MKTATPLERAFTLVEVTVSTALMVIAVAGALWAFEAVARYATNHAGPHRAAALAFANQIVTIAQDAWKYGSPGPQPAGTWQTTLPLAMPNATTMPVTVSAAYQQLGTPDPSGVDPTTASALVTVTVTYTPDPGHDDTGSVSAQATLHVQAPPPGAQIAPLGDVPAPAGAP